MDPLDVVAKITISLHSGGAMSISGNIGDVKLALGMIDHARDAVKHQMRDREEIVVPNRDVAVYQAPEFPTCAFGDMRPEDRGDL